MLILALDLSSRSSGFCIGDEQEIIKYGCIVETAQNPIKRIAAMRDKIYDLINKYNITHIVVEEVRTDYKNAHTYKLLNYIQCVTVLAAYDIDSKITVEFMQPSSWRSKIGIHTGRGIKREELKQADIKYANEVLHINTTSDDIADACCLYAAYIKERT